MPAFGEALRHPLQPPTTSRFLLPLKFVKSESFLAIKISNQYVEEKGIIYTTAFCEVERGHHHRYVNNFEVE